MEVNRQFTNKGYRTQEAALLSKMPSTLSISECAEVAAAIANGSTLTLKSEKNEEPLANRTNARMNLKSRNYVDSDSLRCFENFEYKHTTDDEESKYCCLATTSKETVETSENIISIESKSDTNATAAAAAADNIIRSKREVTDDANTTDRRDTYRNDRRRTRAEHRRNTNIEDDRRKDARESGEAVSNSNFDGLEFISYRGTPPLSIIICVYIISSDRNVNKCFFARHLLFFVFLSDLWLLLQFAT